MNKGVGRALAILGIVTAAGAGFWFGQQRTPAPDKPSGATESGKGTSGNPGSPAGVAVEAAKVALKPLPTAISAVGSLRSDESVTLRPEVAGRIREFNFQEGQRVTKGTTLVRLDTAVNAAEVQQARANLQLAQTKYDRAVDLAKSNFISGQARDEAENNLRVAQAGLQLTEARLAKMELVAPFSGIIGLRSVSVGDYVKEGADIVNLEAVDPLKVDFRVPEIYLRQVQPGQALAIALDATPGKTYEGKVYAVNPLVDAAGRAIVIRALVRNTDAALRPGMFARVRLFTKDAQDAKVVPETALVPTGDEQYVYRIVDGKALRTRVEIGQRRDGVVEILAGLDPADIVVTAGQLRLRDGMTVRVGKSNVGVASGNGNGSGASGPAAKADTGKAGTTAPRS